MAQLTVGSNIRRTIFLSSCLRYNLCALNYTRARPITDIPNKENVFSYHNHVSRLKRKKKSFYTIQQSFVVHW